MLLWTTSSWKPSCPSDLTKFNCANKSCCSENFFFVYKLDTGLLTECLQNFSSKRAKGLLGLTLKALHCQQESQLQTYISDRLGRTSSRPPVLPASLRPDDSADVLAAQEQALASRFNEIKIKLAGDCAAMAEYNQNKSKLASKLHVLKVLHEKAQLASGRKQLVLKTFATHTSPKDIVFVLFSLFKKLLYLFLLSFQIGGWSTTSWRHLAGWIGR